MSLLFGLPFAQIALFVELLRAVFVKAKIDERLKSVYFCFVLAMFARWLRQVNAEKTTTNKRDKKKAKSRALLVSPMESAKHATLACNKCNKSAQAMKARTGKPRRSSPKKTGKSGWRVERAEVCLLRNFKAHTKTALENVFAVASELRTANNKQQQQPK